METIQEWYVLFWRILVCNTLQNSCCTVMYPHLKNCPNYINKTYRKSKNKLISHGLSWSITQGHTGVGRSARTYIIFCVVTWPCLETPLRVMDEQSQRNLYCLHNLMMMMMMIYIYIYIYIYIWNHMYLIQCKTILKQ